MIKAETPDDEVERLQALFEYSVLDTPSERCFDELTELAASICNTPIVLVSLIDEHRQWFKSHYGLNARETSRDYAFCAHAILQDEIFEIPDSTKDERFHDNPLVTGDPRVIFYAGAPLKTHSGKNIGTLCVIDNKPGKLSDTQKRQLQLVALQVVTQLELRKSLQQKEELMNDLLDANHKTTQKNEELFEFASRAIHDIKAPIRQIHSFSDLAVEDIQHNDIEAALKKHEFIHTICNDAKEFIQAVFNLTKAHLISPTIELVDFEQIIKQAISNYNVLIQKNTININWTVAPGIQFYSSPMRCQQIIHNLISNSIKYYNPKQPQAQVTINIHALQDAGIKITVSDNGLGIPDEYKDRLFEPYLRFHLRAASGTGLGTSIIKKHIDALKGTITFNSSENGTEFILTLPEAAHCTHDMG
jgi:signal transduction histidine kinase